MVARHWLHKGGVMNEQVKLVIDTMRMVTRDKDGVIIESLGVEGGVLRIRYFEGSNPECPECVMQPDSFLEMVRELCKAQALHIADVEVVPAR